MSPHGGSRWRRKKDQSGDMNALRIPFYSHFAPCIYRISCCFGVAPLFHLLISRRAAFFLTSTLSCLSSNFSCFPALICLDRRCLSPTPDSSAPNSSGCWNFWCPSLCGHSLSEYFPTLFLWEGDIFLLKACTTARMGGKKFSVLSVEIFFYLFHLL